MRRSILPSLALVSFASGNYISVSKHSYLFLGLLDLTGQRLGVVQIVVPKITGLLSFYTNVLEPVLRFQGRWGAIYSQSNHRRPEVRNITYTNALRHRLTDGSGWRLATRILNELPD